MARAPTAKHRNVQPHYARESGSHGLHPVVPGEDSTPRREGVKERAIRELKEFIIVSIYLFVYFVAILFLKASILHAEGVSFAPVGFAAAKALICGKFMLLGQALRVGETFKDQRLIWHILYRSFAFLVLLMALDAIEEVIVGAFHHRGIIDSLSEIGGGTFQQWLATSILGLLVLIPLAAFVSLGELVGRENLVRAFVGRRRRSGASTR